MKQKKRVRAAAKFIPLAICLTFIFLAMRPIDGSIGHDYAHAMSRLMIGAAHFWQNPLSIPSYTPNLCGGLPFYADPQSSYFSLPQLLTFSIDPLLASEITIVLFYVLGYLGAYWLFFSVLETTVFNAHFGALLFITNGFSFSHLFVGHLTHHPYLLLPWLVGLFIRSREWGTQEFWRDTAGMILILSYCFYSGAMHMLIVFAVCLFFLLPMAVSRNRERSQLRAWLAMMGIVGIVTPLACASKLTPATLYSKHFYVGTMHSTEDGLWTLATRYFWFNPFDTPTSLPFGNMMMSAWEYVGFVSRLTFFALLGAIYWQGKQKDQKSQIRFVSYTVMAFVILIIGWGGTLNSYLPFFRKYHNPIKIIGALILPLVILTVWNLEKFLTRSKKTVAVKPMFLYALLFTLVIGEFFINANFFVSKSLGVYFKYNPALYSSLKANRKLPPVTQTTFKVGVDSIAVATGYSAVECYEPLFGYERQNFKIDLTPDPPSKVREGAFNLTHPGCFLYPDFYKCEPWSRIPETQREAYEKFTHGEADAFPLPPWQKAINYFSLFLILTLSGVFAAATLGKFPLAHH